MPLLRTQANLLPAHVRAAATVEKECHALYRFPNSGLVALGTIKVHTEVSRLGIHR